MGHATSFAQRKLHLGYREARLRLDSPLGCAGSAVRGHEFHYATLIRPATMRRSPISPTAKAVRSVPPAARRGRVTGTFFHAIAQA